MAVVIDIDVSELEKIAKKIGKVPKVMPTAAAFALNETGKSVKTDAKGEIRTILQATYNVKVGGVASALELNRATAGNLVAVVSSNDDKKINITKFKYGKNKNPGVPGARQAWADLKKTAPGRTEGGFYATPNGGSGIFKRVGKSRLPIKRKHGLSLNQMLHDDDVVEVTLDGTEETFESKFDFKITQELDKIFGG